MRALQASRLILLPKWHLRNKSTARHVECVVLRKTPELGEPGALVRLNGELMPFFRDVPVTWYSNKIQNLII